MAFTTTGHLVNHIKTHTGEKSHECGECDLKFLSSTGLRHHWLRHHADKESEEARSFFELINAYAKQRHANDETVRLLQNTRTRMRQHFRNMGVSKSSSMGELIGLPVEEVIIYLNKNQYGYEYGDPELHVDHIRTLKDFGDSVRCAVIQREAFNYLNLQLLTETENLEKGGKYTPEDAAAFKSSEAGIKLAAKRLQWIADGVCEGCEYCKE